MFCPRFSVQAGEKENGSSIWIQSKLDFWEILVYNNSIESDRKGLYSDDTAV